MEERLDARAFATGLKRTRKLLKVEASSRRFPHFPSHFLPLSFTAC